jgi:hypothetical protein
MTFYEFMQTRIKRDDIIGYIAREMSMDVKLFPSLELKKSSIKQWQNRILDKTHTDAVRDYINSSFEMAVKEFESV